MEATNIQFLGSPCGRHGPYTFYKAVRYDLRGKTRILSLGEFFFVKIMADSPLCIGEIQLLWQDKNHDDIQLASARLYFLPEHSPEGRQPHHGEDELLAESEKLILSVEDLLRWRVEDGVCWPYGRRAIQDEEITKGQPDIFCPPGSDKSAEELIQLFSANNRQAQLGIELDELKQGLKDVAQESGGSTQVVVLSYAQYCRYRAVIERLRGCSNVWLKSILISALGGFTVKTPDTRIHFCRETFDHPELEDHDFRLDHLAPNLKGRPRRKRLAYKKDWSPGDSDSNDSVERTATEVTRPGSIQTSFRPNSNGILSGHRKNSDTPSNVVLKKRRKICDIDETSFLQDLHRFMCARHTPISRMPTLGFKEINLYEFYMYAQKLGGYEEVTNKRLWKHIYDRLGGNPSNTSAATCTRRHYEKLLLPYEMHVNGVTPKVDLSMHKRKSVPRSTSNTVRNHLKENTQGKQHQQGTTLIKQESDVELGGTKSSHVTNGLGVTQAPSAYTLNVPNTSLLGAGCLKPEGSTCSNSSAQTLIVPLNVPASGTGATNVLLPPGITLTPSLTVPTGMLLSLQQLREGERGQNAPPPASQYQQAKSNSKPRFSQNGAFTSLSDTVRCSRPSVIRHSSSSLSSPPSSKKPILNPVPSPRPNIPRTVYGPPNVLPSVPSGSDGIWNQMALSALQPHVGSPAPRQDPPPPRMMMPTQVRVVENKPEVVQVIDDDSDDDGPTDLSMNSLRRSVLSSAPSQSAAPHPVPSRHLDGELPLNLSLKAHNTPKVTNTCVPKLPVNPFRAQASETRPNQQAASRIRQPAVQRSEVTTSTSAQRMDVLPPGARLNVQASENSAVVSQLSPEVINLDSLSLIHPAFPFPLSTLPVVTGSSSSGTTATQSVPTPSLNTSLLTPNIFYPGLPTFALPTVGTQLYPHLYQESFSSSQKNS